LASVLRVNSLALKVKSLALRVKSLLTILLPKIVYLSAESPIQVVTGPGIGPTC